ncbi:hypothetical protein [Novacetimonas hansenii]|uniref:Holin n=2 Tax=Novacetimonas hansenii TaxID=436 RepID=A0ABQ0SIF3_NOVHA|nr:hypothetical protein [Novacetimonas hansenii]GAN84055.1 hypothetical protein Gaha_0122_055 [Novacetimonas hansenii JCM 7643]GBQ55891.1 hypothetical protein AA0243_1043 [Novacetimonas hansenii NRIC 0243]GEC64580.1 hypothetical protein GHA01_24290 [Novacetimonas hansenii]
MDDFLSLIGKAFITGGPAAIVTLLCGFILYLLLNIKFLNQKLDEKDQKLEELITEGNKLKAQLNETLMDLRLTIASMDAKLSK